MSKQTFGGIVAFTLVTVFVALTGCASSFGRSGSEGTIGSAASTRLTSDETGNNRGPLIDRIEITGLQQLVSSDLIIEGTITGENTRFVPDITATEAELDERRAQGLPIGVDVAEYEVTIDQVLKGRVDSSTVIVIPAGAGTAAPIQVGDRVILFLVDISGDPVYAPDQTKYRVIAPEGQFRVEEDNTLFVYAPAPSPLTESYRGKDKSVLEKDILDLVAKLPQPTKEEVLQNARNGADLVIEGTIQGVGEVHFINAMEKPQEWIDQMLAEGKMPGLVLTDYTITVDKVLSDKYAGNPRFFPNWKPLEPGQTIIVTRQGGTYKGVTKLEEPGPLFEIGSREVLFLVGTSLTNYDVPNDGQSRYSTDSRLGRLLIGSDNRLTAFTTKGLGGFYGGQSLDQLEQAIAEFLAQHPLTREEVPAP
ncbi:MAG TPA: hypothetical protein VIK33_03685 [Anaerolineae bacterium]